MNAQQIRKMQDAIVNFLEEFNDCFDYESMRSHLRTYVEGQLSDLPRKSIEPIALKANLPPRTLQDFFAECCWDETLMRDKIELRIAKYHQDSSF